jgi:hypothetical protein
MLHHDLAPNPANLLSSMTHPYACMPCHALMREPATSGVCRTAASKQVIQSKSLLSDNSMQIAHLGPQLDPAAHLMNQQQEQAAQQEAVVHAWFAYRHCREAMHRSS